MLWSHVCNECIHVYTKIDLIDNYKLQNFWYDNAEIASMINQ